MGKRSKERGKKRWGMYEKDGGKWRGRRLSQTDEVERQKMKCKWDGGENCR